MVYIEKKSAPSALDRYKANENATYSDMHGAIDSVSQRNVYEIVLEKLIQDQGGICAYCMRKIPEKVSRGKRGATIEHIVPQSVRPDLALDYNNMLAVCTGNRDANHKSKKTCDASRENASLTINPLKKKTISSIKYRRSGIIYSDEPDVNRDINEILNLNCQARDLKNQRKKALANFILELDKNGKSNDKEYLKRLLCEYEGRQEKKPQYLGILIWWLRKKVG